MYGYGKKYLIQRCFYIALLKILGLVSWELHLSSPATTIWRQSRVIATRSTSMVHIIIFVFNTVASS